MTRKTGTGLIPGLYLLLFFAYLFGPLIIMVITAFNSSQFPRIRPWECFTTGWFAKLAADDKLLAGIGSSLVIGIGVIAVAIPVGLAAAILLSQVGPRLRSALYTIFIAPILVPGVVIGLSTLIFWGRIAGFLGLSYKSFLYDGTFLTILGQVTFIAAYSMLVFLSRIQRFDPTLTEAALDMGATPTQAFCKVLLPFMAPAIGSATVLAFLASLENYNTTVFTIVSGSTFTTVLASKVRYGLDPSISAVAVIIIGATLVAAILYESWRRDKARRLLPAGRRVPAAPADLWLAPVRRLTHPAFVGAMLAVVVGGSIWAGSRHDSSACEAQIMENKRALQQQFMQQQAPASPPPAATTAPVQAPASSVFAPSNLFSSPAPEPAPAPAQAPANGAFAPSGLAPSSEAPAPAGQQPAPASPFAPSNLAPSQ
ncbi:ABC transporter permease [Radicibacter daui]|uniref:ABC transporter permease n=1 Tax=Radicibacter daui TaxID=3064829 RepID=UPI004046D9D2